MIQSPLHNQFVELGSTFGEENNREIVLIAGRDQREEYQSIRNGAAILDRTMLGKLAISGPDRFSWLQGMVSNDVSALQTGSIAIDSFILDSTGHVLSDCRILLRPESLMLLVPRTQIETMYERLEGFLVMEDVQITEQSDYLATISIQGPEATEKMAIGASGAEGQIFCHDRTGSGGFDILVKKSACATVFEKLIEAGGMPVGERAINTARIESGIPLFGKDYNETTLAPETGLQSSHISYEKGCYVGQEIVARIKSRGHTNRRLTGFEVHGEFLPEPGDKLFDLAENGSELGWITSSAYSYQLDKIIAMGYIRHEVDQQGVTLFIANHSGRIPATLNNLPFVTISDKSA